MDHHHDMSRIGEGSLSAGVLSEGALTFAGVAHPFTPFPLERARQLGAEWYATDLPERRAFAAGVLTECLGEAAWAHIAERLEGETPAAAGEALALAVGLALGASERAAAVGRAVVVEVQQLDAFALSLATPGRYAAYDSTTTDADGMVLLEFDAITPAGPAPVVGELLTLDCDELDVVMRGQVRVVDDMARVAAVFTAVAR